MKRIKFIKSLSLIGGLASITAPITLLTGCGCASNQAIPGDKLIIENKVLKGIDPTIDLSKYTKISIPSSVEVIGANAFKNIFTCSQEETGPKNKVTEIILPKSIKSIEQSAFEGCNGITTLDLSALDYETIKNLEFPSSNNSNSGNNSFKEWKAKGTIKYNSDDHGLKLITDRKLIANGLNELWTNDLPAPTTSETHIVDINDLHGAAPGYGDDFFDTTDKRNAGAVRLAQETQEIISKYPGSVFLSAGDYNAGESFSTCSHGETLYPVLKAMDIQYSAVGNHAWEWGKEQLEEKWYDSWGRTDKTVGNYFVTANVLQDRKREHFTHEWCIDESDPKFQQDFDLWNNLRASWADPYKVINMNGHDVCLIGLTTVDTNTDGNFNALTDYTIMGKPYYDASIIYSKKLAQQELKDDYSKIESFILLTHCDAQPLNNDETKIDPDCECGRLAINATSKFDGIIGAHSHRTCAGTLRNKANNKNIWIGQAGRSGRNILDTTLVFDDAKPVGNRLNKIEMKVLTPNIDSSSKEAAHSQMESIANNTIYPVVRNTAKVYEEQKLIAKNKLSETVGFIANKGLPYYYTEQTERQFGTEFLQSETLVEPAGIFAEKGQIFEFNKEFSPQISLKEIFPTSVSFNNLDSLKNGFNLNGTTQRDVSKNEIFAQNPYENNIYYVCLTKDQMLQYINYFLEGAGIFNYSTKVGYTDPVYYDSTQKNAIIWDDNELVDADKNKGVSYPCGCIQFYGMKFNVELKCERDDHGKTIPVYKFKDGLKIYDPTKSNNFDDPDTWIDIDTFVSEHGGYIPVAFSGYTYQGGNAQNRMIRHWANYNYLQETDPILREKIKPRMFPLLTRDAVINYCTDLKANNIPMDNNIDYDLAKKLIVKPN